MKALSVLKKRVSKVFSQKKKNYKKNSCLKKSSQHNNNAQMQKSNKKCKTTHSQAIASAIFTSCRTHMNAKHCICFE